MPVGPPCFQKYQRTVTGSLLRTSLSIGRVANRRTSRLVGCWKPRCLLECSAEREFHGLGIDGVGTACRRPKPPPWAWDYELASLWLRSVAATYSDASCRGFEGDQAGRGKLVGNRAMLRALVLRSRGLVVKYFGVPLLSTTVNSGCQSKPSGWAVVNT